MFNEENLTIAVVGLGYVGLPLAIKLANHFKVIGIDKNEKRIKELKEGYDKTCEVSSDDLKNDNLSFTNDFKEIKNADVVIVAVPTPVDKLKNPDLFYLKEASKVVGANIKKGATIVFESTVYPGVTEEICVPIIEKESGMKWKSDFFVGYSPERVNPGDKEHTIENVVKIVAGDCERTLELLAYVYGKIVKAGIYRAPDIKTAEAAKVIENIQRDINIALMNELALIFHRIGIDTQEVLKSAATKWNFLKFEPGLVGGHCIPVDPYYLVQKAKEVGYIPQVILAGRSVNEKIPSFIAEETIKLLMKHDKQPKGAKVLILGFSFKENVPDTRNTKVFDLYKALKEFFVEPFIYDPVADKEEAKEEYGIDLIEDVHKAEPYDAIIFAVRHENLVREFPVERIISIQRGKPILVDVKGVIDKTTAIKFGIDYWRL